MSDRSGEFEVVYTDIRILLVAPGLWKLSRLIAAQYKYSILF